MQYEPLNHGPVRLLTRQFHLQAPPPRGAPLKLAILSLGGGVAPRPGQFHPLRGGEARLSGSAYLRDGGHGVMCGHLYIRVHCQRGRQQVRLLPQTVATLEGGEGRDEEWWGRTCML